MQDADGSAPSLAARRKVIVFLPWCTWESLVMHYGVENCPGKEGVKGELGKTRCSGKTNAKLWARGDGRSPSGSTADLLQTLEANRSVLRASVFPSLKCR